jgi:hypothetical protein
MPIIAGILEIVSGIFNLIGFIVLLFISIAIYRESDSYLAISFIITIFIILTVLLFIAGILAVVGGNYAVRRKKWGWALTGSIFTLSPTFWIGLIAIILTVLSKNEFEQIKRDFS